MTLTVPDRREALMLLRAPDRARLGTNGQEVPVIRDLCRRRQSEERAGAGISLMAVSGRNHGMDSSPVAAGRDLFDGRGKAEGPACSCGAGGAFR